jgi:hypothetical protein
VKLSQEEMENLQDMMSHDGMKALRRVLAELVRSEEARVLSWNLDTSPEGGLVRLKLRAEGAAKLVRDLDEVLGKLKARQKA